MNFENELERYSNFLTVRVLYGIDSKHHSHFLSKTKNYQNYVNSLKSHFGSYNFVMILIPDIDLVYVKDYQTLGVQGFQKFKGIKPLSLEYPFILDIFRG